MHTPLLDTIAIYLGYMVIITVQAALILCFGVIAVMLLRLSKLPVIVSKEDRHHIN